MNGSLAATPTEALTLLRQAAHQGKPVDLAIIDMEMPEMDGLRLAHTIKADPTIAAVHLVLLTSLGRCGDSKAAQDAGFVGYLTKPIRKDQLQACLETAMGYEPLDSTAVSRPVIMSHQLQEWRRQKAARILVADDHHVNQQLAVMLVERLGHRADVVANGKEALEALSRIAYDAILMDCHMPELDGYEATRGIRQVEGQTRHTPIIAMTANAMKEDREKCLTAGMDEYISKPIRPEELARVFAKWLPQQQDPSTSIQEGPATLSPLTSPSASTDQPAINGQALKELEDLGGPEFLQSMIQKFVEDSLQCVTLIEQALDAQNIYQLQEAAHGLKGIARNMGADLLAQLAGKIEANCKAGNTATLSEWRTRIQGTFQQTRQELEDVLRNA